jgi:hypothetical protein
MNTNTTFNISLKRNIKRMKIKNRKKEECLFEAEERTSIGEATYVGQL